MVENILTQFAGTGIVGAGLVLALLTLRAKDKELSEEKQKRIDDAKQCGKELAAEKQNRIDDAGRFLDMAMKIQKEVTQAVATLGEIMAILRKEIREARGEEDE